VLLRAGGEQSHRCGFAVRAGHERGRDVVQLLPWHIVHGGERGEEKVAPAAAASQCQAVLVLHVRQRAPPGCAQQRYQLRTCLALRQLPQALQRGGFLELRDEQRIGIRPLQRLLHERRLQIGPLLRVMRQQRRAQRPLVDLGRHEQRIRRGAERERGAARMHACHHCARPPAERCAGTLDARAPAPDQRLIGGDPAGLQLRAAAREEQVGADQAP